MTPPPLFAQIKLHRYFGGGEVFARSLAEAAADLGGRSLLFVHPDADHWRTFRLPAAEIVRVGSPEEALAALPPGMPLITHAALPEARAEAVARERPLVGFVHMPYDRYLADAGGGYRHYHRVVAVSDYVASTLAGTGFELHDEPFYGVAGLDRLRDGESGKGAIVSRSEFEWDRRKVRDRLLGLTEPLWSKLRWRRAFVRRPGLTLGVVSRIAPIKQFPLLFSLLVPHLRNEAPVHLEIFGAGGYASMRDLRRSLAPLGGRVRYWGHQPDVASAYRAIDVLVAGLPEREALGLNVIEAQAAGVPVLAVAAPPFTETVVGNVTGYLYRDPREDSGADFAARLREVRSAATAGALVDPREARRHLQRFSREAFRDRLDRLLAALTATAEGVLRCSATSARPMRRTP